MSVDITMKARGLFSKPLTMKIILGDTLSYGTHDQWILRDEEKSDYMVLYDPNQIGRGINIEYLPNSKEVGLRLLTPTPTHEVELFYDLVERIASYWNVNTFIQDEVPTSINDLVEVKEHIINFNRNELYKQLDNDEYLEGTWMSAIFPIHFNMEIRESLKESGMQGFTDYLHDLQYRDVYYGRPLMYMNDVGDLRGIHVISEEVDSVFPYVPYVPFGTVHPKTGELLEIDDWTMVLVFSDENEDSFDIPYNDFMDAIQNIPKEPFDAQTFQIRGLTKGEMNLIIQNYTSKNK